MSVKFCKMVAGDAGLAGVEPDIAQASARPGRRQAAVLLASANSAGGTIGVELSWNEGTATTTAGYVTDTLTTSGIVYDLGGSSDMWGRGDQWAPSDFSDANFRLRIIANPDGDTLQLDALQVRVYHQSTGGGSGGGGDI